MAHYTGEFFGYREIERGGGWVVPLPPRWTRGTVRVTQQHIEALSPPPYKYQVFAGTATDDYSDLITTDFPCRLIDIQVFDWPLEIQLIYNVDYWEQVLATVTPYDNIQEIVDRFWNEVVGDPWRVSDRLLQIQTIRGFRLRNGDEGVDSRYQIIVFE